MNEKPKEGNFLFPKIYDLKSAQDAAHQGVSVCVLVIVVSWVFALIFTATGATTPNYQLLIAASLLYGSIAMMIYKMSRLASIAGLIIYLIDRIVVVGQSEGNAGNAGVTVILIFMFVNSIRGTFAYHRIRRDRQTAISQEEDLAAKPFDK